MQSTFFFFSIENFSQISVYKSYTQDLLNFFIISFFRIKILHELFEPSKNLDLIDICQILIFKYWSFVQAWVTAIDFRNSFSIVYIYIKIFFFFTFFFYIFKFLFLVSTEYLSQELRWIIPNNWFKNNRYCKDILLPSCIIVIHDRCPFFFSPFLIWLLLFLIKLKKRKSSRYYAEVKSWQLFFSSYKISYQIYLFSNREYKMNCTID